MLDASGYGVVSLAMAVVLYLSQIADFGIDTIGNAEIAKDPKRIETEAPYILTARIAFAAVITALAMAVSLVFVPAPEGPIIAAAVLRVIAQAGTTKWIHIGLESAIPVGVTRILGELLMLGLVLLLVHGPGDIGAVPVAQVSGEFLVVVGLLVWLGKKGHTIPIRWDVEKVRPVVARAWPVLAHSLLGLFIYNSDLFFVRVLRDSAHVGYYAAAYTLVSFLLNVGMTYGISLMPTLARLEPEPEAERDLYQTSMAQIFAVALPAALGGTLLAPAIIGLAFGEDYGPSAGAMQILIWSMLVTLYRSVPMAGLLARGRQDLLLKTSTWAAGLNVVLNVALIPPLGIVGAGVATLITEGLRTALALKYARDCKLESVPWARHWRASLAGAAMCGALYVLDSDNVFVAIPLGGAAYGLTLLLVRGISLGGGRPRLTV